jgi:serine/threonine protein kinase
MVAYVDACEIPAFVTMEWIEGPNLLEAKEGDLVQDWSDVLNIGLRVTEIIKEAHALPQRILHRDIRPSNVMLQDYWANPENYEVVVLDFDLSWHRGAQEASVLHTTAVGYLAPEQIIEEHDGSTRNAAVDAFGIGMTLYYLCGGIEPLPELHRHADYNSLVRRATNSITESGWHSLSERMSRLIIGATRDRQSKRWDLSQIYVELANLLEVHTGDTAKATASMVAEEMAAQMSIFTNYQWEGDENCAKRVMPTGLTLKLMADEPNGLISIHVDWMSTGAQQRVGMAKYVRQATRQLVDKLRSSSWRVVQESSEVQSMSVRASQTCAHIKADIEAEAARLDGMLSGLRFSD